DSVFLVSSLDSMMSSFDVSYLSSTVRPRGKNGPWSTSIRKIIIRKLKHVRIRPVYILRVDSQSRSGLACIPTRRCTIPHSSPQLCIHRPLRTQPTCHALSKHDP